MKQKMNKAYLEGLQKKRSMVFSFLKYASHLGDNLVCEPLPGGGGTCSHDPLIFLDFIPCSPLVKHLVPKNVFSSCSLDREIFLRCSLDPQKYLSQFPIFVCLFYLYIHSRKNRFRTASFFSLKSAYGVLHRLPFLLSQLIKEKDKITFLKL